MNKKELKEMRKIEEARQASAAKKASMVKWVSIGVVATVFVGFFLFLVISLKKSNPNFSNGVDGGEAVQLSDSGEFRVAEGSTTPAEARPVTLVEFADIQCPACQQYHPMVKNLLGLYPETLAVNFKHFPISSIHPNAVNAAVAAEAANNQNKFFEMVDLLYERQGEWSRLPDPRAKFIEYAKELELDTDKFTKDLDDSALKDKIDAQRNEGITAGVNATPTFFVNGVKIQNPADISGFQAAIDAALEGVSAAPATSSGEQATPSAESQNASPQINL